eukprot:GHVH01016631.1.p1 GENE.GHVH01016631.1~~GHVH01016631.1.p1  ORF type:complete len:788 (-),score=76.41 GHVH01016631.1:923-3286(-)
MHIEQRPSSVLRTRRDDCGAVSNPSSDSQTPPEWSSTEQYCCNNDGGDELSTQSPSLKESMNSEWWWKYKSDQKSEAWWSEQANKKENMNIWKLPTRPNRKNVKRKCTNPLMAFIFFNVWVLFSFVTAYMVNQIPAWGFLRLKDDEGNMCGGPLHLLRKNLSYTLDYESLSTRALEYRHDQKTVVHWLDDNPEDWALIESEILSDNSLFVAKCTRSCLTTVEPVISVFPRLIDCEGPDKSCLTMPLGNGPALFDALCVAKMYTIDNPLENPLVMKSLNQTFSWIGGLLSWLPFTLSERSIVNIMDVWRARGAIPISMFIALVMSLSILATMKYFTHPLIVLLFYLFPTICLCGVISGATIFALSFQDELPYNYEQQSDILSDFKGDVLTRTLALILMSISILGLVVSVCVVHNLKTKIKSIITICRSAANFCHANLMSVFVVLFSLLLSVVVWGILLVAILSRISLEEFDNHRGDTMMQELKQENINMNSELIFPQRYSTISWLILCVYLGIWTAGVLRGYSRIAISLIVLSWIDASYDERERDDAPGGRLGDDLDQVDDGPRHENEHPVLKGSMDSLYHLGTAVLGGAVLACTSIIRYVVKMILIRLEKLHLSMTQKGSSMTIVPGAEQVSKCFWGSKMLIKLVQVIKIVFCIIDRAVRFVTVQVYVHTALLNHGFLKGAYSSFLLMSKNGGTVLSVITISRLVVISAAAVSTSLGTLFSWFCVWIGVFPGLEGSGIYLFIICFCASWFVSKSLFLLNTSAVDTILHLQLLNHEHHSREMNDLIGF